MYPSKGSVLRQLITNHSPVAIVGTVNAYCALLAEHAGCKAIYLSGAGVANATYGLPDLAMTSCTEVVEEAQRLTAATDLPLLVDIDTGWGHYYSIGRTIKLMEKAQVAAVHIEDQITAKRCGHRMNKAIVSMQEMGDRIKAAVDARINADFFIIARTDAYAIEGLQSALDRASYYIEQGADAIFPEALQHTTEYAQFTHTINRPILANLTEFGQTPLFTKQELAAVGIQLLLYQLSAFRAMSQAALNVYQAIETYGTQKGQIHAMQTRADLYQILKYETYEKTLDKIILAHGSTNNNE